MFVSDGLGVNESGHLTVGGCDTVSLAKKYGTPYMCYDENMIRKNCREFVKSMEENYDGNGLVCYASKAFSCLEMCRICKEEKKGIFVLVKTSNPSSGEFQDQKIDGRPLYELVGEKVAAWGSEVMGDEYSYVGAVVGATYPEMGKVLRKVMPKAYILVPGYGAQGGKGKDLVHFFNEDGLGAIVNSSRGIIAAYKQEKYANYGEEAFADASRAAVEDMVADIRGALEAR